ncbi:hypothetical protein Bhyg_07742 [Pseudolycoriella hygida]|uniref:CUB domain-containing protein n=1 Tax=Pseudolycoriella hygida TaxID=35572 RepID=A0A9Q0N393_9DIPT|nr:hypothetical protein Bhyg_07742 [Pseudolycoriella hygida]
MFLKHCLLLLLLNFVVRTTCDESVEFPSKDETLEDTENQSKVDEDINSIASFEITLPFNESLQTNESTSTEENVVVSENSLSEGESSAYITEDPTSVPILNYNNDTSTYDATEDADISGVDTETFIEGGTYTSTLDITLNITDTTPSNIIQETTVLLTEDLISIPTPPTLYFEAESGTESETLGNSSCPIPKTTIDEMYENEALKKSPLTQVYKAQYPSTGYLNCSLSVTLSNCTGVDVVIHYLDLDPFQPDFLNIRGGEEDASNEMVYKLTGKQLNITYKIIHTNSLYIWFNLTPTTGDYQGFLLTYTPYGNDTPPTTTIEPPFTIPPYIVQVYELQLVVSEKRKTNETWKKFKEVLANSASKYVTNQSLNYQLAFPDNVTIDVFDCPKNWPNYKDCVRLEFSVSLWSLDYDPNVHFDLSIFDYELSTNSLSIMWDLYGRDDFLEILGIEEYSIPDGKYILLLWTGISLTIITIFIGILYSIWRIDIFREYRRMHSKNDDLQDILKHKSELDISMYPIPHQPYPTLFDTAELNCGNYYDAYESNTASFKGHGFCHEVDQEKTNTSSNFQHSNNHFSPNIIDFTENRLFPDEEDDFSKMQSLSPRSKHKLLVLGAKREESIT